MKGQTNQLCFSPDLPPGHYKLQSEFWVIRKGVIQIDSSGVFSAPEKVITSDPPAGAFLRNGSIALFLLILFLTLGIWIRRRTEMDGPCSY